MKSLEKVVYSVLGQRGTKYLRRFLLNFDSTEKAFTRIYRTGGWVNEESASGPGSTLEYTENLRRELPILLGKHGVTTMLDAPCGDYHWFKEIHRENVNYIGADIVGDLVAQNTSRYADSKTRFCQMDITSDPLPDVDLWLCRDVLFHLSTKLVHRALENFSRSKIDYLLTTTHPECRHNSDIPTGSFRELNLQLEPFGFPEPIAWIDDWIPGFPVRKLGLWKRTDLAEIINRSNSGS